MDVGTEDPALVTAELGGPDADSPPPAVPTSRPPPAPALRVSGAPRVAETPGVAEAQGISEAPHVPEAMHTQELPRARPTHFAEDVLLRGRYLLEEKIGVGGTAVVYRARDLRRDSAAPGGQRIALKVLRPGLRDHPRAIARLKREFHHAQTLSHPSIARVYDVDCDGGVWFLTLELLEGDTLAALLDRQVEPLPARRVVEILRACGEALAFAHERGVVHGDFKPGNVFITGSGQVRVLDFGSASASWLEGERDGTTATPAYASPDVLSGKRAERRDDIFSFACVAYELFSGRHPFDRRTARDARLMGCSPERNWNLSTRQWQALEAALSWSREERPASIRVLLADLTATEVAAPLVLPEVREPPAKFRSPRVAPFSAIAALAALGAVIFVAHIQLKDLPSVPEVMDRSHQIARDLANLPPIAAATRDADESSSARRGPPKTSPAAPVRSQRADSVPASDAPARRSVPASPTMPPASPSTARAEEQTARTFPLQNEEPSGAPSEFNWGLSALVSFDQQSVGVSEGASSAVLRINRRGQLEGRSVVLWRTIAGSARAGQDFREVASGAAEFADGQTTRAIYVPLLNDLAFERDETFTVELYGPDSATQVNPIPRVTVTVRDNDSANEYQVAEHTAAAPAAEPTDPSTPRTPAQLHR